MEILEVLSMLCGTTWRICGMSLPQPICVQISVKESVLSGAFPTIECWRYHSLYLMYYRTREPPISILRENVVPFIAQIKTLSMKFIGLPPTEIETDPLHSMKSCWKYCLVSQPRQLMFCFMDWRWLTWNEISYSKFKCTWYGPRKSR